MNTWKVLLVLLIYATCLLWPGPYQQIVISWEFLFFTTIAVAIWWLTRSALSTRIYAPQEIREEFTDPPR